MGLVWVATRAAPPPKCPATRVAPNRSFSPIIGDSYDIAELHD
jgi:hypothetical protein